MRSKSSNSKAHHPIGTMPRLMFSLALNTGQRRGDLIRIGRQHFRRGVLHLKQSKTGAPVAVPVLPDLQAAIDAMGPPVANFRPLLANPRGGPFSPDYATAFFAAACRAGRGFLRGFRYTVCERRAADGWPSADARLNEIASIWATQVLKRWSDIAANIAVRLRP